MGGSQSAPSRKLTIPNEDSHFIKVSEAVVERLKTCQEKRPDTKPLPGCPPPTEMQKQVKTLYFDPQIAGDALINYYYGPSLTSIRVLQQKEKELKESEDYWTKRISEMEKQHVKLGKIMDDEYHKALKEISCQTPRPPPNAPFPCFNEKTKVLECYKKNKNETLLCAGLVSEFSDCVHSKRINFVPHKGC